MIYQDKKGNKWYLHTRKIILPRNRVEATSYYFKKEPDENYYEGDLPIKYTVKEYKSLPLIVKK